jgi:hypothetical protein
MARLWKRKDSTGTVRFYADLREFSDVIDTRRGSGEEYSLRMALKPEGASKATADEDVARELLQEAVKALERRRRDRALGVEPKEGGIGLGAAVTIHLEEKAKLEDVTDGWLAESEHMLGRALEFFGAHRDVTTIEPTDVRDWIRHLGTLDNGRGGKLSGGTQRHHINTLSNFFGTAVEKGWVGANPVAGLRRGTKPSAKRREAEWFEPPEASLILEMAFRFKSPKPQVAIPFVGPLIATFLLTGGRKAEVLGLMAGDVARTRSAG